MANKAGKGALFYNQNPKNERSPQFTGEGTVETVCPHCNQGQTISFFISGWNNKSQDGNWDYQGLMFTDKMARASGNFQPVGRAQPEYSGPTRPARKVPRHVEQNIRDRQVYNNPPMPQDDNMGYSPPNGPDDTDIPF